MFAEDKLQDDITHSNEVHCVYYMWWNPSGMAADEQLRYWLQYIQKTYLSGYCQPIFTCLSPKAKS